MPVPVIQATKVERIEHPDGRVDVVVHMPVLDLAGKVGIEKAREITGLPLADSPSD